MPTTESKDIIEALDLSKLEPEEQEEILLDLNDLIYKGTMVRLIERMDDTIRDQFNELLEKDASEDEVEAFIEANVPNADSAVVETIDELRDDILAVIK